MSDWIEITQLDEIPVLGSRVVKTDSMDIAIFRTSDDRIFAVKDACPNKQGPSHRGSSTALRSPALCTTGR